MTSINTSTLTRTTTDHFLVFAAIGAAIVSALILTHYWWLLIGLAWLFLRVVTLGRRPVIWLTLAGALAIGAIAMYVSHRADLLTLKEPRDVNQLVEVHPDQVDVNGDLATVRAKVIATGQEESLLIHLRGSHQQSQLKRMRSEQRWRVSGRLQPLIPPTNFNQFDTRLYQRSQGVYNSLSVDDWQPTTDRLQWSLIGQCHQWRAWLHQYFLTMPQPLGGYCQRLLIGENDRSTSELMDNVKKLGVIHLFCISGIHVVLLTTLLRRLLVYCYLSPAVIDPLLALVLLAYLVIGGGSASLIRAVVMAECTLLGRRFAFSGLDRWALSLLVGLAIDPYLLLFLGGQLSYLLSLLLQVLDRRFNGWQLAGVMNLASLPSLLTFVYQFHLLSFISSYLMIPVFSMVIFPAVIISALTFHFLPVVGLFVNWCLSQIHQLLAILANLPGMVTFGKPQPWLALVLLLIILTTFANPANKRLWLCSVAAFLICFVNIHFPLSGEVTFVDIGQGDSIIVRTPFSRHVALIDTGGRLLFTQHPWQRRQTNSDLAKRTSINYLKSLGISHLDAICLSHHDMDHIGYLSTVLSEMKVDTVLVPAGMEKQPQLIRQLGAPTNLKQPQIVAVTAGAKLPQLGLQVLHPFGPGKAENTDSMVLFGKYGGKRFLFTGDLDIAGEGRLLRRYPRLHVDVLKLGHHGSKTASSTAFLRQVNPQIGIISAGRFNRYGHPNRATMSRIRQANIQSLSTQQFGMIRYRFFRNRFQWQTKLQGDELRWMLPPYDNS